MSERLALLLVGSAYVTHAVPTHAAHAGLPAIRSIPPEKMALETAPTTFGSGGARTAEEDRQRRALLPQGPLPAPVVNIPATRLRATAGGTSSRLLVPVVFLFTGALCPDYQQTALQQATRHSPGGVYLIADPGPCAVMANATGAIFEDSTAYNSSIATARRLWPAATLRGEYEFGCVARWFVLRDFMARRALQWAFYSDSDVLLFGSPEPIVESLIRRGLQVSLYRVPRAFV